MGSVDEDFPVDDDVGAAGAAAANMDEDVDAVTAEEVGGRERAGACAVLAVAAVGAVG